MNNFLRVTETKPFELSESNNFFSNLRRMLRRVGLAGVENLGVGVYFVAMSSGLPHPLRLSIEEQAEGNVNYLVQKVGKLLRPGTLMEISSTTDKAWKQFEKNHENKAVYLSEGDGPLKFGDLARFEVDAGRLSRVNREHGGEHVMEKREEIDAAFACISARHRYGQNNNHRWLTMGLEKNRGQRSAASNPISDDTTSLTKEELSKWHGFQKSVQKRMQKGIAMPEWLGIVHDHFIHHRRADHLAAFLGAWETMCALRSSPFERIEDVGFYAELDVPEEELHADLGDLAATNLLAGELFRESWSFPFMKTIFNRLPFCENHVELTHPLTGRLVNYKRKGLPIKEG